MSTAIRDSSTSHAIAAGVVTAVVGFSSSFAVVLTGLMAVGASQGQAASGLAIVSLTMGLESFGYRTPLRSALTWAGVTTVVTAPAGGFSTNLAAISAALAA